MKHEEEQNVSVHKGQQLETVSTETETELDTRCNIFGSFLSTTIIVNQKITFEFKNRKNNIEK